MRQTDARMIASLEDFMLRTPLGASGVTSLTFEGLRGRRTQIPMPMTNLVGAAGPGVSVSDSTISDVFDTFGDVPFGWLVGPNSPGGLAARLQERGMQPFERFAGLGMEKLARDVPVPPGVRVREAEAGERPLFADLLGRSFGLPPFIVEYMCEFYFFAENPPCRNYFGYVDGVDDPVGTGSSIYEGHGQNAILTLAGSAVLPVFRKRGVYHALVQRRFEDAIKDGMRGAVIQARRGTSEPICRRLGFDELCSQVIYSWSPKDEHPAARPDVR